MGRIQNLRMEKAKKHFKEEMSPDDKSRSFYVDYAGNAVGFSIERVDGFVLSYDATTGFFHPFEILPEDKVTDIPPYVYQDGKIVSTDIYLQKHMDVDVLAFLEAQMKRNTQHYQSDFQIDKAFILTCAKSQCSEDKTLLWLSRHSGTECVKESEAFIRDSASNRRWQFYTEHQDDSILAFTVELTGEKSGVIRGNIYELNPHVLAAEINSKAVQALEVEKTFEDGFIDRVSFERSCYGYYAGLINQHGPIVNSATIPVNKEALVSVLDEQKNIRSHSKMAITAQRKPSICEQIQFASTRATDSCSVNNVPAKDFSSER